MLAIQDILQNGNFVWFLAISVPLLLTAAAFTIFYFGFRKKQDIAETSISSSSADADLLKVTPTTKPKLVTLSDSLSLTRSGFLGRIKNIFSTHPQLSSGELDELEEILYTSDLGPQTVQRLMQAVEAKLKIEGSSGFDSIREAIKNEMLDIFSKSQIAKSPVASSQTPNSNLNESLQGRQNLAAEQSESVLAALDFSGDQKPRVLMIVGVNGAGKTTSIGKISGSLAQQGKRVLVAAGDTFRAAAGSQLKVWTERAQVEIFSPEGVSDPSAVAFGAVTLGKTQNFDVVIIDTAGRLHTQKSLMEELKKMKRVITKVIPDSPHEILLVLDASSGQNALQQAREFHAALGITGVVLTKLDGTAKGGVALGLAYEMQLPIKLIGIGEGIGDLRSFNSHEFVDSII